MRICARCVLPDSFPGLRLDDAGVCSGCRLHEAGAAREAERRRAVRATFQALAEDVRSRPGHHCVLAYSGGKDSTYTLLLLRRHYGLRVLAVTLDNGFVSPRALANIRRVTEVLGASSLLVRPPLDLLARLFSGAVRECPYPPKALERASTVCNACIGLVKGVTMRVAVEQRIPLVAYGWSPGQAPVGAALNRPSAAMMRSMHEARSRPLLQLGGDDVVGFLLEERHLGDDAALPHCVSPLAFHDYDEAALLEEVRGLGWRPPSDTDGNSTNCCLNLFATRHHLARHGFHPYALEVAGLVRAGVVSREAGLASLADLGSLAAARRIARRLGVAVP